MKKKKNKPEVNSKLIEENHHKEDTAKIIVSEEHFYEVSKEDLRATLKEDKKKTTK